MMLGKLKKIDLREAWKHEALDFTNWLAKDENLSLLSDEIGIGLQILKGLDSLKNALVVLILKIKLYVIMVVVVDF